MASAKSSGPSTPPGGSPPARAMTCLAAGALSTTPRHSGRCAGPAPGRSPPSGRLGGHRRFRRSEIEAQLHAGDTTPAVGGLGDPFQLGVLQRLGHPLRPLRTRQPVHGVRQQHLGCHQVTPETPPGRQHPPHRRRLMACGVVGHGVEQLGAGQVARFEAERHPAGGRRGSAALLDKRYRGRYHLVCPRSGGVALSSSAG